MAKTTPWNEVKADYLAGVTPKELANKYDISDKKIREKASKEGWVGEKETICNNVQQNVQDSMQERIKGLTNLALDTLVEVINSPETESNVKVQASKAILDISGLKSSKQEISGVSGANVIINREAVHIESNN